MDSPDRVNTIKHAQTNLAANFLWICLQRQSIYQITRFQNLKYYEILSMVQRLNKSREMQKLANLCYEQVEDHLSILAHHFFAFRADNSPSPNCMVHLSNYSLYMRFKN